MSTEPNTQMVNHTPEQRQPEHSMATQDASVLSNAKTSSHLRTKYVGLDADMSTYQQLLSKLDETPFRLAFPRGIEANYLRYLEQLFYQSNLVFLKFAIPVYLSFFFVDLLLYKQQFAALSMMRAVVFGYICMLVYLAIRNRLPTSIITGTSFGLVLCLLHVLFGSMLFSAPYDAIYVAGTVPVYVYAITLLRFSFKHSLWFCCFFILCNGVGIGIAYMTHDLPANIEEIYRAITPIMFLFMVMIACTGLFLSYAIDKLTRENWLREQIVTIESAQLADMAHSLKLQSETDSLTGLKNRRFFDRTLTEAWLYATQHELPLSLIMLDVDWFKTYNDHYGHQQGDDVLQHLALKMTRLTENTPYLLTRYGGEEFFIILPDTVQQEAEQFAETLRSEIMSLQIPHSWSPLGVCTLSLGVLSVYPHQLEVERYDVHIRQVLKQVDDALYSAKEMGKNRVVLAVEDNDF